jgi:AcrR family transcriptional regulator
MVIRPRAIHTEDKEKRYHAILKAAERLLLRSTGRDASMAQVAAEAGLAKGTVYLYFSSKEELLLALFERNIDSFFAALTGMLEGSAPLGIDPILALMQRKMVEPPLWPVAASDRLARACPSRRRGRSTKGWPGGSSAPGSGSNGISTRCGPVTVSRCCATAMRSSSVSGRRGKALRHHARRVRRVPRSTITRRRSREAARRISSARSARCGKARFIAMGRVQRGVRQRREATAQYNDPSSVNFGPALRDS